MHHAIRSLMHTAAADAGLDPDRFSFIRTLRLARRQATAQAAFPPDRLAGALRDGVREILDRLRRIQCSSAKV